jgi:hypothetical protein
MLPPPALVRPLVCLHDSRLALLAWPPPQAICLRPVACLQERKLQARLEAERTGTAPAADVAPAGGGEGEDEDSPFAAISATLGWDCFHWVTMLWILLRWGCLASLPCVGSCTTDPSRDSLASASK